MEILTGHNPTIIKVSERWFHALSPVTKNYEQASLHNEKARTPRVVTDIDLGSLIHGVVGAAAESRFRTVEGVFERVTNTKRIRDEHGSIAVASMLNGFHSPRWTEAYGRKRKQVIEQAAKVGIQLIEQLQAKDPNQMLVSELRFMASPKSRVESRKAVLKEPKRAIVALRDGDAPIVPHVVDVVPAEDPTSKSEVLSYYIQAIPDVVGFSAKTLEALQTRRRLMRMIYQNNEGNKRFMLEPELLENNQELLLEVMQHMLNGDMRMSVTEVKTNSWLKKSLVGKPDEEIYDIYKHDIGHTLLALMNVFRAVAPGAFRGKSGQETASMLVNATDVHIGVVDFPSLGATWFRRMGHIVPKQPTARLVTLTNEQVQKACTDRLKANIKYCLRHQTEDMCI